jgi:HSP20 family protein
MVNLDRFRWDPFRELWRLQEEINDLFEGSGSGRPFLAATGAAFPRINLATGKDGSELYAEVPGVSMKDIDLSIEGTTLRLAGERTPHQGVEADRYFRSERGYGSFGRAVRLPHRVDLDKVEAKLEEGILRVRLPLAADAKARKIEVRG